MNNSCEYLTKFGCYFGAKQILQEIEMNTYNQCRFLPSSGWWILWRPGWRGSEAGEETRGEWSMGYMNADNKNVEFQGMLPVHIKQIHALKDNVIKMWGFEFEMVSTVAIVREIERSPNKITYTLSDITGKFIAEVQ